MKRMILRALVCGLMMTAPLAHAQETAALDAETAKVKALLEQKMPHAPIKHIEKTPYFGGLYEVLLGGEQLIYTDAKVSYVIVGSIVDMDGIPAKMTNLTEDRLRVLKRVDVSKIPLEYAFKRVKGNGKRVLYLFSDIDCPFCERIEENLKGVDNVTIYTYLLPLDMLHPDAARKSSTIWCAPDRAKAWEDYFSTKKLPDNDGSCETPIKKIQEIAEGMGVRGTPALIFVDGTIVPGAIPKDRLETELARAEKAQLEIK